MKDFPGEHISDPAPLLQMQQRLPISLLADKDAAAEHNESRSGARQQPLWRSLLAVSDEKPSRMDRDLRSSAGPCRGDRKPPSRRGLYLGGAHWPVWARRAEGKRRNHGVIWGRAPRLAARCAALATAGGTGAAHLRGAAVGHQWRAHGPAAPGK